MAIEIGSTTKAIQYAVSTDFDNWTAMSLSAWVLLASNTTGDVMAKWWYPTDKGFTIYYSSSSNKLAFECAYDDSNNTDSVSTAGTLSTETWYHVLARWSASTRDIWLDGVQGDVDTDSRTSISDTVSEMMVGAQDNDGTLANPWEGDLQDVGVWNAYLTDEEIAALAAGQWCNRIRPASLQLWVPVFHRDYICDQSQNRYAETQTTAGGYGGQPGPPMAKLTRDRLVGDPYVAQAAAVDPSMLPMDYELIRPGRGTVKSLAF